MITNGGLAEVYCVIAKTEENEFSCVLVDMNMPGFEFGARENFMGLRGCPLGTLFFDNIRVPEYHLLGQRGQGMMIGDFAHYDARIYMGGLLAGAIKHGMDIAVSYALRSKTGSVQLPEIFPIQEKISNIAITHKNILLLTNEAFRLRKCHKDYSEEVATMVKAYGSKAAFGALEDGIQILDGYGYSKEYPIEYILRDVRALQLMEGSYEKMMYEISEEVTNEYK